MRLREISITLGAGLLLMAAGCGGNDMPTEEIIPGNENAGMSPAGGMPTEQPEATPAEEEQEETAEEYNYDPIGKRDPFKSLVVEELTNRPKPKTPLQQYDIDQLSVVGIIWGISNPKAMIKTPDGKGYVVGKGTPIGKGRGKVTRITQREVVISEEYRDFEGKLLVNETALKIKQEESL